MVVHLSPQTRENQYAIPAAIDDSFDPVKRFITAYRTRVGIAALPGKERRNELEKLGWIAVADAIKFARAQKDPELRLLATRVVSSLIRTELAILHEQDAAAVDELVAELEADRDELETKIKASTENKTST
jgi:hypothetical protein